jgi:hypothetical protein
MWQYYHNAFMWDFVRVPQDSFDGPELRAKNIGTSRPSCARELFAAALERELRA